MTGESFPNAWPRSSQRSSSVSRLRITTPLYERANSLIHVALIVKRMEIGGMERCITRVANGLDPSRFRVSVICLHRGGAAIEWITRKDVSVLELGVATGNNWGLIRRLAKLLREMEVDIAHSHNWATLIESHIAARLAGRKIHAHAERGTVLGPLAANRWRQRSRAWMMRYVVARAAGTMTNAYAVAEKIRMVTGLIEHPVTVIPNGLDIPYDRQTMRQFREQTRLELGIPDSHTIVGTVGRLVAVKNFAMAIGGLAVLKNDHTHLLLVGEGPEEKGLKSQADLLGVSHRVHFMGRQSNVWPYLAAMDLYTNTSHSEGMSQSLLEAMACGLPILATNVGDSNRLICSTEVCGRIVESNDVVAYANNLEVLTSNKILLSTYARASQNVHTKQYSLQAMIHGFETFYLQLFTSLIATKAHKVAK